MKTKKKKKNVNKQLREIIFENIVTILVTAGGKVSGMNENGNNTIACRLFGGGLSCPS